VSAKTAQNRPRFAKIFRATSAKIFRRKQVKRQNKKGNQSMKNGDTVAMVIAFFLVLPWLARLIVSAKAVWRALTEGSSMKKAKRTNQTRAAIYQRY
jgi:hypothetical protein